MGAHSSGHSYGVQVGSGGLDRLVVIPEGEDGKRLLPSGRTTAIAALVTIAAVLVVIAWGRSQPGERACTLAPVAGAPDASSATAALDAWWTAGGSDHLRDWSSFGHVAPVGSQPTRADLHQVGETTWEWRYLDQSAIRVEVGLVPGGSEQKWAIVGIGQCAYAPFDLTRGA